MKLGKSVVHGSGYKTRTVNERLNDLHSMFADDKINAVFAIRGGYGSMQLLNKIDYLSIRKNPKVFLGYSDITAMHLAINKFAGLVTFHGPVGVSNWNEFTRRHVERILFQAEATTLENPLHSSDPRLKGESSIRIINHGKADGKLVGGNLSVLTAMLGSDYLPDWDDHILFLEDIREEIYRKAGFYETYTCLPILAGNLARPGESVSWIGTSLQLLTNSLLGGRTNRDGTVANLASAITGRTPYYGFHKDENRKAEVQVELKGLDVGRMGTTDLGAIGYWLGRRTAFYY